MTTRTEKIRSAADRWGWIIPAVVLGLYSGRVISEWVLVAWPMPILITATTITASIILLRRFSFWKTWPILLLLMYVIYPYPDPSVALGTAVFTLIALVLSIQPNRVSSSVDRRFSRIGIPALLIGIVALLVYFATIAPDILPADSGEFQLIATELGVAHPPGFPLYTILAHLMTKIPFEVTPAFKVNLLSVMTSTATLVFVYLTVQRLTNSVLAGASSAFALGASTTFWAQATTANIRSLTALFAAIIFYLFILITRPDGIIGNQLTSAKKAAELSDSSNHSSDQKRSYILLPLFFFVVVAGVTHHASLVFIGVIVSIFLIGFERKAFRYPRVWGFVILAGLLALIPLIYLPLRGLSDALGSPEDINTMSGFLNHVLATGFRGDFFYFIQPGDLWERLIVMANVMTFQFPTIILFFMIAGLILLAFRDPRLALLLISAFILHTLVAAVYRAPQTVEYMMPAYIPAVILLGYFIGEMDFRRLANDEGDNRLSWQSVMPPVLISLTLIVILKLFIGNFQSYRWLHEQTDTRDYAQSLLENAPEDSLLLAGWHWVTPLRYLQTVEGKRPDVEIAYVFPTNEEYFDTWARSIDEALGHGKEVVVTHYDEIAYHDLPLPQPLGDAYVFNQSPTWELPADYDQFSIGIDGSIEILGSKLNSEALEVGQEAILSLAWHPTGELPPGSSLYIHLVGRDGQIYAQDDLPADFQAEGITFTQFRLTPRPNTVAGEHRLFVGVNQPGDLPDQRTPARTLLGQIEVDLASQAPFTQNTIYRPLADAPTSTQLIGYDWDDTVEGTTRLYLHWQSENGYRSQVTDLAARQFSLPKVLGPWGYIHKNASISFDRDATYIPFGQGLVMIAQSITGDQFVEPDQELKFEQIFAASTPVLRDLIMSLRLVGYEEDGLRWAWWDLEDGVPAMGAIPTLKWITGSTIQDPRWLTVDQEASPEQQVQPLLRIYDAFTNRPLTILDERITDVAPWLRLGELTVSK